MKTYILIIIVLMVFVSCTYQRPLLSIRVSSEYDIDPITHETNERKAYYYWGIKKITKLGGYSKTIILDSLRNKITITYTKRNPWNRENNNTRYYKKVCYYSPSAKMEKMTKHILQNHCLLSKVVANKIIYYKNGKIESRENLKKR